MTNAGDRHELEKDPGLAGLVLILPILILQLVFARFAERLDRLKAFRRRRPKLANWRSHFGRLRQCEWHIHQILANGARQVMAFGDVDLRAIPMWVDVPEDFPWSEPSSPAALHIRMQGLARFHSDPERYIRRHAERIRRRVHEAEGAMHQLARSSSSSSSSRSSIENGAAARSSSSSSSSSSIENGAAGYYESAWTLGIPAPP